MKKLITMKLGLPLIKHRVKKLNRKKDILEEELKEVNKELNEYTELLELVKEKEIR